MAIKTTVVGYAQEIQVDPWPALICHINDTEKVYLAISCYSMVDLSTGKTKDLPIGMCPFHGRVMLENK